MITFRSSFPPVWQVLASFVAGSACALLVLFGWPDIALPRIQTSNTVVINVSPIPDSTQWTLAEKLAEARETLRDVPVKVGDQEYIYAEDRISRNGIRPSVTHLSLSDVERTIALALLDTDTGAIEVVSITKRGDELISPDGYRLDIVPRASGIRWNAWNTNYAVVEPKNRVVLMNKFPIVYNQNGKRIVDPFLYAPFSDALRRPDLVQAGREHIRETVIAAFDTLRIRRARSKAYHGILVADAPALRREFFERIPLLEQSDFLEFALDPEHTVERVLALIGLNGESAFANTGSVAGALGWVQYTEPTYQYIRGEYPEARLTADFETGANNHLNSMMAAILLHDNNLVGLMHAHGNNIVRDPRLEEYLAASYNGSPTTAFSSLSASVLSRLTDWISRLHPETKEYIAKLRYLQEKGLP